MAAGDVVTRSVWEAAFEHHYQPLIRVCFLLCGDRDMAEDLTQEAFVRAAAHLEALPEEKVWPYLRRAMINLWKNRLRRLALERRVRQQSPSQDTCDAPAAPTIEDREALWQRVLRLPKRQRACLVLRYYEELSERETADTLGISIGTVKSQTARALRRLREELDHVNGG